MPVDYQIMLTSLIERKAEVEKTIDSLNKELLQINSIINSFDQPSGSPSRYNWSETAIECIKGHNRFLQTTDILECVLDPETRKDEKKKKNATVGISVALNNLCSRGTLKKIVIQGVKGHFYGLPEWFNEDGSVKKEYLTNLLARHGQISEALKLDLATLVATGLIE